MEWGDLRLFLAIARHGSVRAAAAELGINQSTVNRRMDVLEHTLNLTLFDRTTRGFVLTEYGHAIAAVAAPMQSQSESVLSEADRLRRKLTGALKITGPQALGVIFAIPIIEAFRSRHPGVIVEYDGTEKRLDLHAGEADVAFRAGFLEPDATLAFELVLRPQWAVYCSAGFASRSGMPANMAEIQGFPVVTLGGLVGDGPMNLWFMEHIDPARIAGVANSVPNMSDILHAGLGIGILPCLAGDREPGLNRCFDPVPEMSSGMWIVTTLEARRNPRVAAFVKVAMAWFQGNKVAPAGRTQ